MLLSKITINNFRLIVNAELDVHQNITLIVGRNNTAKTSCMNILEKVVKNRVFHTMIILCRGENMRLYCWLNL